MFYALWDVESGNSLGDFDSEAAALVVVRDLLEANEPDYAAALSLGRTDDDGTTSVVADGAALAARAQAVIDPTRRTV